MRRGACASRTRVSLDIGGGGGETADPEGRFPNRRPRTELHQQIEMRVQLVGVLAKELMLFATEEMDGQR